MLALDSSKRLLTTDPFDSGLLKQETTEDDPAPRSVGEEADRPAHEIMSALAGNKPSVAGCGM